jgi:molecular chaperone GrpE
MADDKDQRDDIQDKDQHQPSPAKHEDEIVEDTDRERELSDLADESEVVDEPESDASDASVTPPSASSEAADGGSTNELAEVKDSLLRVRADFDNFKRRAESDRTKTIQVARTDVILDLLPVIDNFDRAFADVPQEIESNNWYQGVAAIKKQFEKMLQDLGIERIETVGQEFDPELHEAIAHEASDQAENVVVKEFEAGYRLGDAVIRHARVAVSSGHSDSNDNNSEESKEN